jgi:predicted ThiF/HesA family dinucleotide-utilizing enzyme
LSAATGPEHLWNQTLAAFGLTRKVRSNRQAMDRDRERELAAELRFTDQISGAIAAPVTSARGTLWEAAKRAHRLIPTPEVFGSTKKIRRNLDRRHKAAVDEESREFQFTVPGTLVILTPRAARTE